MAKAKRTSEDRPDPKWVAVRRGKIYCAPRCGCGCTVRAFEKATKQAAALCVKMGAGWEPHVWENCGWHYSVGKGAVTIHANTSGHTISGHWKVRSYWANFQIEGLQVTAHADTAEDALGFVTQEVRGIERRISDALHHISEG